MLASPRFHSLYTIHLLELSPEVGGVLVVAGLFGGGWIVLDEPGEELRIVDLFAAGVSSSSLYLFCCAIQAIFIKKDTS